MVEAKNMESSHWWWLDSRINANSNRSPWLQNTLAELDEKTKKILKLIEEDADSFAQRAEMYYKKRPELITMVEDFYRTHRSLAERFDQVQSESPTRLMTTPWSLSPLSFTKYRLEKSLSLNDKSYDSYSEAYGPDESEVSDESEVDDPDPEEEEKGTTMQENHIKFKTDDDDQLMGLRKEVERLEDENNSMKDQLMAKDEEKREVIRQLTQAMDMLREENAKLRRQCVAASKNSHKKDNRIDFNKLKEGFFGNLFGGFGKSSIPL